MDMRILKSWQILSSKSHVIVENDTETVMILKAVIFFFFIISVNLNFRSCYLDVMNQRHFISTFCEKLLLKFDSNEEKKIVIYILGFLLEEKYDSVIWKNHSKQYKNDLVCFIKIILEPWK